MRTNEGNKVKCNGEGPENARREKQDKNCNHCLLWVRMMCPGVMVLSDIRVKMLHMEQLFPKMGELAEVKVSSI